MSLNTLKYVFALGVLFWAIHAAHAQTQRMYKYVVFFQDKDTSYDAINTPRLFLSEKAIARKQFQHIAIDELDLPVNVAYLQHLLQDSSFIIRNTSGWFNCAIVFSETKNAIPILQQFPGVKNVIDVGYSTFKKSNTSTIDLDEMIATLEQKFVRRNPKQSDTNIYGAGLTQAQMLNIPALHKIGLNGSGTTVAVIDAGFSKANSHKAFSNTLKNVVATYDFVDMEQDVFNDDDHGTAVWSCIGANDSFSFVGSAPMSKYVLLRSEDALTEFPVEEFYWAIAAEFADSIGVDMISSSLGYNEFGDSKYNYSNNQLNGRTSWITQAATIASKKGILVINSAGNEGDNQWKQIAFPADADDVITVGAVDKQKRLARFSSIGLTADKRIKPDLMAMGEKATIAGEFGNIYTGNGTSYSCPVLAGGIACLWPEFKKYNQAAIKNILHLSASNYYNPDKYLGYGVPDLWLAYLFAQAHINDTLLDVRMLDDKCFHVSLVAVKKQKILFTVTDDKGKQVLTQTEHMKNAGNIRLKLNKLKKIKAGKYTVMVQFADAQYTSTLDVQ